MSCKKFNQNIKNFEASPLNIPEYFSDEAIKTVELLLTGSLKFHDRPRAKCMTLAGGRS